MAKTTRRLAKGRPTDFLFFPFQFPFDVVFKHLGNNVVKTLIHPAAFDDFLMGFVAYLDGLHTTWV
jgi:hypothetical protein